MVVETGISTLALRTAVLAEREMPLNEAEVQVYLVGLGKGAEILRTVENHVPCAVNTGKLLRGETDHRIRFSVFQVDIVLGLPLLDEVVLKEQGLVLRVRDDDFDALHGGEQKTGLDVLFTGKVGPDTILQGSRFADVNDRGLGIPHDIDPWFVGILAVTRIVESLQ
jgi:hypothetical protein